jgi:hypothetical protein
MTLWKQWVNLPKEERFVGGDIESLEHLGSFSYSVTLERRSDAAGEVRVVPTNERVRYSDEELARYARFHSEVSFPHFGGEGTGSWQRQQVYLAPAGGNRYRVAAHTGAREVRSDEEIEVWRKLYYEVYFTRGVQLPSLDHMERAYRDRYLVLERVGGTGTELEARPALTGDELDAFVRTFPRPGARQPYEPYAFAILFVEMWCRSEELDVDESTQADRVTVQSDAGATTVEIELRPGEFGWRGIDEDDDRANGGRGIWLAGGGCVIVDDQGAEHPIPDEYVELIQQASTLEERRRIGNDDAEPDRVRVRIPPDMPIVAAGVQGSTAEGAQPYRLQLSLNIIANLGGTSYSEPNLIVLGTYSWFDRAEAAFYEVNTVHEVGHKVGMTPGRAPLSLDSGRFYYENQGHNGPHCSRGMRYNEAQSPRWRGTPACVMFGAARYHDGDQMQVNPAHDFCTTCGSAVQKQDLDVRFLPWFSTGQRL